MISHNLLDEITNQVCYSSNKVTVQAVSLKMHLMLLVLWLCHNFHLTIFLMNAFFLSEFYGLSEQPLIKTKRGGYNL